MVKKCLFALLWFTGVTRLVAYLSRHKVAIICYHSITESSNGDDVHKLHLPRRLFIQHLDHLSRNYRVISLNEFLAARRERRRLPNYSVVLIFDDGFEDFFTVATAELGRNRFPATVFVITDYVSGNSPLSDYRPLSWNQVEQLAAQGFQVGSHTHSHPYLLDLPAVQMHKELDYSRASLLKHVGQANVALSYPYGQTSSAISKLAETIGYSCGITGKLGLNSEATKTYELYRTTIASDDDRFAFAARAAGLTWWVTELRQLLGGKPEMDPQAKIEIDLVPPQCEAEEYSS